MSKSIKNSLIILIVACALFIMQCPIGHCAVAEGHVYPSFGLFCSDIGVKVSGDVKIDLTSSDVLSQHKAIKQSVYSVSGNRTAQFDIPFFSDRVVLPMFDVIVDGQVVKGDIWYGDDRAYYGDDRSFVADSSDNEMIELKLKNMYSPELDSSVIGTLFTMLPDADEMTVSMDLKDVSCYIYESSNLRTESYLLDKTVEYEYKDVLSHSNYRFFLIGENGDFDFSATCGYQEERISFKEFIDRNHSLEKEFYDDIGVPKERLYPIANRLLQSKGGMKYDELFHNALYRVGLNAYRFTVPLDGQTSIKYYSEFDLQVDTKNDATVYAIGCKQIGNYTTDYNIMLNKKLPYIIESSVTVKKVGAIYKASTTESFYFVCSSSDFGEVDKTLLLACFVCGFVGGTVLLLLCIEIVLRFRKKRKYL